MDSEEFYLVSDNDYLITVFEQELAFVQSNWKSSGRPTMVVMLTNQMTTKVVKEYGQDYSVLVPALGESWGHACTSRVLLFWQEGVRKAWLAKSPHLGEKMTSYAVVVVFCCPFLLLT